MLDDILKRAAKLTEPSDKEIAHVDSVAARSLGLVWRAARNYEGIVDVMFGGSYAKGTWLRNDVDVDIFVKIKQSVKEKEFEGIGRKLGFQALKAYKPYLRYSQHPYVEAVVDGVRVDVVPCYDVEKGKWISAADRSPYHTKFVTDSLDNEKRKQARLLKRFMKGIGVYGAEIARAGFSGYVCEVLILKYGSFMNVLRAAAEFRENQVISIGDVHSDIAKMFNSALIIPDPVDPRRNLGTAISHESASRFILAARRFLGKPELRYFAKPGAKKTLRKFDDKIMLVKFRHGRRSQDIIWGQLKSSMNAIAKQLEINGFSVIRMACGTDENKKSVIGFMLESIRLPELVTKQGPKVFGANNSSKFLQKNMGAELLWIDGEAKIMALVGNRFTDAAVFMRHLLKKKIDASGVSRGLARDMKKSVEIYTGRNLASVRENFIREVLGELAGTDELAFGKDKRAG